MTAVIVASGCSSISQWQTLSARRRMDPIKTFKDSLVERANVLASELKDVDTEVEFRALVFRNLLMDHLYCPECWVRSGRRTEMHQARWLISCGEHDYRAP